jgi:hypothetical protein
MTDRRAEASAVLDEWESNAGTHPHRDLRVIAALRVVLGEHQPDGRGLCHTCAGRPYSPCRTEKAVLDALLGEEER